MSWGRVQIRSLFRRLSYLMQVPAWFSLAYSEMPMTSKADLFYHEFRRLQFVSCKKISFDIAYDIE